MSFTFSIPLGELRLEIPALLEPVQVRFPGARWCDPEAPTSGSFPAGIFLRAYQPGVTVRAPELSVEEGVLNVRLMACSTREDLLLGIALAELAARWAGSVIQGEDETEFRPEELLPRLENGWLDRMAGAGSDLIISMVESEGGQCVAIDCAIRTLNVGPKLVQRFRQECRNGDSAFPDWLVAYARLIQYGGTEAVHESAVFRASDKKGKSASVAVWAPLESRIILPKVDYVALMGSDQQQNTLHLSWEATFAALPPTRILWWDDLQFCSELLTPEELAPLRRMGTREIGGPSRGGRPWWKFWD